MDRRAPALAALMLFAVATVLATVLDGRLPASEESVAGWVVQGIGYLAGITGGVLLLAPPADDRSRRTGVVVMVAMVVLLLVDALAMTADGGGANIGLGGVRLIALLVLAVATVRLAQGMSAARGAR